MIALVLAAVLCQDPLDTKVDDFAKKLPEGTLRDTLLSKPGKVALKEALSQLTVQMRDEARKNVVPDFFKAHFDENGALKDKELGERWLKDLETATSDLKELKEKAAEFAGKIADEPAANAQIKKAIQNDAILGLLYITQLRILMGRDEAKAEQVVMQRLGALLVPDMEGKLVIREDVKEQVDIALSDIEKRHERVQKLSKMLADYAKGLKDEGITGKIKQALGRESTAIAILQKDKGEADLDEMITKMNASFTDGVLDEDKTENAEKLLAEIDRVARRLDSFRGALDRISAKVKEERLRDLFKHDTIRLALLGEVNAQAGSAKTIAEAFEAWVRTLFVEEDGSFSLNDEAKGRVTEGLKKAQNELNQLKKAMATVAKEAEKIAEDEKAKAYFTSPVGQVLLLDSLKASADAMRISEAQAFAKWTEKCFDGVDVREEAREHIDALIEKAAKIKKQLENNDINPGDK